MELVRKETYDGLGRMIVLAGAGLMGDLKVVSAREVN